MVIGGGIAGTLSAIALRKAGMDAVIYEAYDKSADHAGAFLTLAVNALDALRTLDIDLGDLGFDTPSIILSNGSGSELGRLSYGSALDDGTTARTVKRADLYRVLREHALSRGLRIEYGKRLTDATPTGHGVRARFADGGTADGDLLIGADGLRSRTRHVIDPEAPPARYTGLLTLGGYARGVTTGSAPGVMNAVFGKRCFFSHTTHPGGEVWWAANPAQSTELAEISTHEWRARLVELFRRDQGPAVDIIGATATFLPGWNTYDLPRVPRWHRDRMIIIGDAAHATAPSIGQGAAMAIEDTVVLATCLRDQPGVEAAFAAYERARRPRVEKVVAQGNRTGAWKALNPLARVPRDLIMRLAMSHMARTGHDPSQWIYDHHIDWEPVAS